MIIYMFLGKLKTKGYPLRTKNVIITQDYYFYVCKVLVYALRALKSPNLFLTLLFFK
jgi:hypothetical protein